jgi:hypothetical protein
MFTIRWQLLHGSRRPLQHKQLPTLAPPQRTPQPPSLHWRIAWLQLLCPTPMQRLLRVPTVPLQRNCLTPKRALDYAHCGASSTAPTRNWKGRAPPMALATAQEQQHHHHQDGARARHCRRSARRMRRIKLKHL